MPEQARVIQIAPTALSEYRRYFPHNEPSCFQQDLIEGTITDLERWKKALEFWASNNYRAQSIGKIMDYYEQLKPQYRPGFDTGAVSKFVPEPPCDICGKAICFSLHREERG